MSRRPDSDRLPGELLEVVRNAQRIAVLCGAGLSADSGIPTFREAQTGLWARYDPMELASPEGFSREPELVWRWYQWRRELVGKASPNAGHHALASLLEQRPSTTLITQNVDGLQQRAGGTALELHGNLMRTVCSKTRRPIDPQALEHEAQQPPPSPHHPLGLARPDVVWFGEALDDEVLERALRASRDCEVMFVVGTSGLVHPAAGLPGLAGRAGALLVEINPQKTAISDQMHWHWPQSATRALPRLVEAL